MNFHLILEIKNKIRFFIFSLLFLFSISIKAQKYKFIPKTYEIQYAGNTGMISISSIGNLNKVLSIQLGIGYVPKMQAEKVILSINTKFLYTPKIEVKINKIKINPIILGVCLNYTFGNKYNKYYNSNQYGKAYYWWGTAFRYGFLYRCETIKILKKNKIGLYFELSTWDLDLYSYWGNNNQNYLDFNSLFTFGLGTRIYLNNNK